MRTEITAIEQVNSECVRITAVVYWRGIPKPNQDESYEDWAKRVKPIADEIRDYNNLHIGWAQLHQKTDNTKVPKSFDDYYS